MTAASTSVAGAARYRNTGAGRELAQDTEIFSLDDETAGDEEGNKNSGTTEKSRLFDCPLDSDEEEEEKPQKNTVKSRTDAFEGDGDSLSDELDLLPPLPGAPNVNTSWTNRLHSLNCCNPRIPSKCVIM